MALLAVLGANLVAVDSVEAVEAFLVGGGTVILTDCSEELSADLMVHGHELWQLGPMEYRVSKGGFCGPHAPRSI